jgi:hypothetical protein
LVNEIQSVYRSQGVGIHDKQAGILRLFNLAISLLSLQPQLLKQLVLLAPQVLLAQVLT